jgi:hypothetical protein
MAKIIYLEEKRLLKSMQTDINLSISQILDTIKYPKSDYGLRGYSNLSEWFGEIISKEIVRRNMISEDIFLCGIYIATMLAEVDCDLKKYAFEYLEKWSESSDPNFLKMGGDFCFVLCGGFSARCERRMMKLKDYQEMGASFYDWFYLSTGKPIGRYMSANFELMQQIVNSIWINRQ